MGKSLKKFPARANHIRQEDLRPGVTDSENPGADARRKYDDREFLAAVRENEPASTREVSEHVGCPRRTADYRLRKLREAGSVESKLVGNSLVWLPADGA